MSGILLNVQYFCFCFPVAVYSQTKPVYKGHSREPENVPFMDSYPLCTG